MLKLDFCVVCEKVIYSQEAIASLINLFGKIAIVTPANQEEMPRNAVAPKEWAVFSRWNTEPGDELKEYFVCTQVFYPDQSPFGEVHRSKIAVEPSRPAQLNVQMVGFPIGQAGTYTAKVWVEESARPVTDAIERRIEVEIHKQ
jgi:hypothetical protein